LLWGCHGSNVADNGHEKDTPFRIIGYYKGTPEDVGNYEYQKLTHVIFCFTYLKGNKISLKDATDEETLKRLAALKHRFRKLKVMVALGGWGGCETCSPVFNNDSNRIVFAKSVKDFLIKYKLDGFDLDWESPVIGGYKNHPALPEDRNNFTDLIYKLRQELPQPYELSFDANSFPEFVLQSVDWQQVMPNVSFVNLMTYGLPNDKPKHTGHHTALYSSPYQKESIHSGVLLLDSLNVPHNKIIIGAGFYGFVVQNVDSTCNGLGQLGKSRNAPTYKEIIEKYTRENGYRTYWDSTAMAPYLYSKADRTFITFDNKESCILKTKYAISNEFGGLMFWRLNGDRYRDGLLDAIDRTVKTYKTRKK
jgi:chitinase